MRASIYKQIHTHIYMLEKEISNNEFDALIQESISP